MTVNKNGTKEKILTKLEILFSKSNERKNDELENDESKDESLGK